MLKLSRVARSSRYTPIVGCAFLVETLYGSKYSANLGSYSMPYVYVKTILLCATGHGLELREGRYIHGLIELLLPSKVSQDNLTKLELLQFVDAIPMDRMVEGREADTEEEAEAEATMALMSGSNAVDHPSTHWPHPDYVQGHHGGSGGGRGGEDEEEDREALTNGTAQSRRSSTSNNNTVAESAAAAARRRQQEQEEEDAAAIETIMSFVSPATFPSSMARVLIYDAVCTCVADGLYSAKEKERVALVSSHIGLSTAVRGQIEKLALQEKVLSIRKRRLLLLLQQQRRSPPSHIPLEEERLRQASSALGQRQGNGSGGSKNRLMAVSEDRRRASARALGGAELARDSEEVARVEAAKTLLRRARRREQKRKFFAANP